MRIGATIPAARRRRHGRDGRGPGLASGRARAARCAHGDRTGGPSPPAGGRADVRAFARAFRYQARPMRSLTPSARGARRRRCFRPRETRAATPALLPAQWWLLGAITAVGAAVRLLHLGEWSLWIDEAHTWRDATMPLSGPGGYLESDRVLYPLTFLLLRGLLALGWIGEDPWSLRLPFVLLGIGTVPLLAVCGRWLVGTGPALLAAALLAVHPWHVYWSQNARGYVVVVAAAVVAGNRMLVYVQRERLRDLLWLWAALVVGTLSHPTGLLLALAFAAFLLLLRVRSFDRASLLALAAVVAAFGFALPWIVETMSPYREFAVSKDSPSAAHFLQTTAYYFRPVVLLSAAAGVVLLWRGGDRRGALALGCLAFVPLGVLLVVGGTKVLTTARYAICALPMVTWLAAYTAVRFANAAAAAKHARPAARWLLAAALPLILAGEHAAGLVDYHTVQHGQRARWAEAVAFLRERAAGRPLRVATVNHPTLQYYLRPGQHRGSVPREHAANAVVPVTDWMIAQGKDERKLAVHEPGAANHLAWHRAAARATGALFALVVTMPELEEQDPDGTLRAAIAAQCRLAHCLPCWVGPKDDTIHVYLFAEP
jgi:hypothetical protein